MKSNTLQGLALLTGTIIGVGVFAMPYVMARAGFWVGAAELFLLAGIVLAIHLMYGDVALALDELHQLPGYAKRALGRTWEILTLISSFFGLLGSLVVYVLLGSGFLATLIHPVLGEAAAPVSFIFFLLAGAIVFYYDSAFSTKVNGFFTALLILALIVFIALGLGGGSWDRLAGIQLKNIAAPYGVILFALAGASVIPRVRKTLGREKRNLRFVIIAGTLLPAVLYFFFAAAVMMGSGQVTPDAISGFQSRFGAGVLYLGAAVGFLATITSYFGIGLTFQEMLEIDVRFPRVMSWAVAAFFPFVLVLAGVSDFIWLIGIIGAFGIGFDSIAIVKIWQRIKRPVLFPRAARFVGYLLIAVFAAGFIYEIEKVCRAANCV